MTERAVTSAVEAGAVCAVAGRCQRDLQGWMAAYPGLFSAAPFDAGLAGTLGMAMAFSGPWFTAEQLRMACKVSLWAFALDWLVDYVATSADDVDHVVGRCLAVSGGAEPPGDDELSRFLADIRDELAAAPSYSWLGPVWQEELRAMLEAMSRERAWRDAGVAPSFYEYLGNADNLGFTFAFTAHLLHTGEPADDGDLTRIRDAAQEVQRVIRLLNDLGTYERDVEWDDLNVLLLGVPRDEVERRITALASHARDLIALLRPDLPRVADYLERQMDFCAGFYKLSDYWGSL
ncbi:terpene synthase family protein [Sphaerisporangium aureirubrum]|uniref:Terpene synthase family protein n=1 Tax=Sphaerisporangium aureirubrum TaxID=1544736 RepID=A0ABW1NNV4_9ACTN